MRLSFWNNQKTPYPFHIKKCEYPINAGDLPNTIKPKQAIKQIGYYYYYYYYYGARYYNPKTSLWLSVDPLAEKYPGVSSYTYCINNPVNLVDPDGSEPEDFVQRKDGSIYWDDKANNQATTKAGETYLGKVLKFNFISFIKGKLWDGPMGNVAVGTKLTSIFTLTASENSIGEITGASSFYTIIVGDTPMGTARDYYPGEGGSNNKQLFTTFKSKGKFTGFKLSFEQHASVSPIEKSGLNLMGYKIVDVAQKMDASLDKKSGNLSINAYTNIFPSATLSVNKNIIMYYPQPSFVGTHTAPITKFINKPNSTGSGMVTPIRDYSYYPSKLYKR